MSKDVEHKGGLDEGRRVAREGWEVAEVWEGHFRNGQFARAKWGVVGWPCGGGVGLQKRGLRRQFRVLCSSQMTQRSRE